MKSFILHPIPINAYAPPSYDILGSSFAIRHLSDVNLQWRRRFPDDIFDKPVRSPHVLLE